MCFRVFSLWTHHHLPTCKRQATHRTIFMPLGIGTSGLQDRPQKLSPKQWTCIRYTKDTWMLLVGPVGNRHRTQDVNHRLRTTELPASVAEGLHPQIRKFKQ